MRQRVGYYVTDMEPPHRGHESGDIGGPFKTYEEAKRFANEHLKDKLLGIYRVWGGRGFKRRDLQWSVYPEGYSIAHRASHATKKKSPAQLQREIDEVLGAKPISRRKTVRHFSESKDKLGRVRYAVTYEDLTSHTITPEELASYREREARGAVPRERRYR